MEASTHILRIAICGGGKQKETIPEKKPEIVPSASWMGNIKGQIWRNSKKLSFPQAGWVAEGDKFTGNLRNCCFHGRDGKCGDRKRGEPSKSIPYVLEVDRGMDRKWETIEKSIPDIWKQA